MTDASSSPAEPSAGASETPDPSAKEALDRLRDEMLRKVGRNLLNFQKVEGLLKLLVPTISVEAEPAKWDATLNRQVKQARKLSLGKLARKFADMPDVSEDESGDEAEEVPGGQANGWVTVGHRISMSAEDAEALRVDLDWMVKQRNALVHHFLARCQPESGERLEQACAWLDEQREKLRPIHDRMVEYVRTFFAAREKAAAFCASPEFANAMETMILRQSPLAEVLRDVAQTNARPDGWAYLSTAGDVARRLAEDDFLHLKERYGYRSFRDFARATGLFEVSEEPTGNGNLRTLFRLVSSAEGSA